MQLSAGQGSDMKVLLAETAARSARYSAAVGGMRLAPQPQDIARLEGLGGPLPQNPSDPKETLALLDDIGSPATLASTGGRYFGFVTGGALPAAVAANWLAAIWDQNAAFSVMSPVAAKIEEIVLAWTVELLALPQSSGAGFVTGTTMANFSALAAARTALLQRSGWDVEDAGLFGAPPLRVVVGEEALFSGTRGRGMGARGWRVWALGGSLTTLRAAPARRQPC